MYIYIYISYPTNITPDYKLRTRKQEKKLVNAGEKRNERNAHCIYVNDEPLSLEKNLDEQQARHGTVTYLPKKMSPFKRKHWPSLISNFRELKEGRGRHNLPHNAPRILGITREKRKSTASEAWSNKINQSKQRRQTGKEGGNETSDRRRRPCGGSRPAGSPPATGGPLAPRSAADHHPSRPRPPSPTSGSAAPPRPRSSPASSRPPLEAGDPDTQPASSDLPSRRHATPLSNWVHASPKEMRQPSGRSRAPRGQLAGPGIVSLHRKGLAPKPTNGEKSHLGDSEEWAHWQWTG